MLLSILLIIIAGIFLGSFGVGMKYTEPLAYEAWWSLYVVVGMVIVPLLCAFLTVPDLADVIATAPKGAVYNAMLYGFLWGVGGLMFGISVGYVGVSITYGVVMGLSGSIGSLIPFFRMENATANPAFPFVMLGVGIMLLGVGFAAVAGVKRDNLMSKNEENKEEAEKKSSMTGLIIVIICGVLSSLINVGFDYALPVAANAVEYGAIPRNASFAAWVVVLIGALALNTGYILFMLVKNNTWHTYKAAGSKKAYGWGLLSGLLWFLGLGVYGQGASLMGKLGTVVGWPMFLGLALIVSNIWAIKAGEWKGATGPLKLMGVSVFILIIACGTLGYANSLMS
ncbi:MAG: rhamnose/proton symporter RhaT [Planctomycetes bacterium]|nr:rhamnose/proton symporter RhaT [Planctomycetota bacterium]